MFVTLIRYLLNLAIDAYLFVLLVRMVVDWVLVLAPRWYPTGVAASIISVIYTLTEPPLRWLRRYIKPLPLGNIQLDVSFMVLVFALMLVQILIG